MSLVLLLLLVSACGSPRTGTRPDRNQGSITIHVARTGGEAVELDNGDFHEAVAEYGRKMQPFSVPLVEARRWVQEPSSGEPYARVRKHLGLVSLGSTSEPPRARLLSEQELAAAELKRCYLQWCERTWGQGDCLRLLVDRSELDGDGKYTLAMAIAQRYVLGEMKEALGEMVDPLAVYASITSAMTMYLLLWSLPEPISKGLAATLTVALMAYLGVDTVWRLSDGWLVLMREVDRATSFDQIEASGKKYGKTMGWTAAKAFFMLATVAVGNTAAGLASKLPLLPGAGQAAVMAESQLSIRYVAVAQVKSVAVSAQGATLVLAPNAVAMTAKGSAGGSTSAMGQPPPVGPGEWVQVDEHMSEGARTYQAQTTGAPRDYAYRVKGNGVEADFDGYEDGVLLEVKGPGYAKFYDDELKALGFFKGDARLLDQARRQLRAARGTPIRWVVAEEKFAAALKNMFNFYKLKIEVLQVPPAP